MGILSALFAGSFRDEAVSLVADFIKVCPPPDRVGVKAPSDKKVAKALDDLCQKVLELSTARRFGPINRARLAKAFQDELLRTGYPADVVAQITSALTFNALTSKPK